MAFPLQPSELLNCPTQGESQSLIHGLLNDEIDSFCKQVITIPFSLHILQSLKFIFILPGLAIIRILLSHILLIKVAAENMSRKPYINWAIKRVTRSLQVLWPRSRTNIFGSSATGLALPSSDVDLVVCLPPVRNLVSKLNIIHLMHYLLNWKYLIHNTRLRNLSKRQEFWRVAMV